jgi:hypothetical protein
MTGECDDEFWTDADDPNQLHAAWTSPSAIATEPERCDAASDTPLVVLPGRSRVQEHLRRIERRVQSGLDVIAVLAIELVGTEAQSDHVQAAARERLQLIRGAHVYDGEDGRFVLIVEWIRSRFEAMTVADRVHRRLHGRIGSGDELDVRVDIGVRVSLDGAQHLATFVQDAEAALAEARQRGGGATALWAPGRRVLVTGRVVAE